MSEGGAVGGPPSAGRGPRAGPPLRVLVVEDEQALRELLARQLGRRGFDVTAAGSAEEALAGPADVDVALCDLSLPGLSGIELLRRLRQRDPAPECVVLTGQATVGTAIEAMKLGAYHYLEKPVKLDELELYLRGAGDKRRLAVENRGLRAGLARQARAPALVGRSPAIEALRRTIERVAASPAPVLVEGETGTGKDLVARALHQASPRRDGPFVAINCGALSEALLENELFGHAAGAYTGATKDHPGVFEAAHGGTLFVDEVAEMSLETQKKLLRVLENGELRRLGETRARYVDVRVVAATNRSLRDLVAAGKFREDLYFRLGVLPVHTPALREHPDDLPDLVAELLERARAHYGRTVALDPAALAALQRYPWPGNVRELRNVLERAMVLAPADVVRPADLEGLLPTSAALRRPTPGPATPEAGALADGAEGRLEDVERDHIRRVLEAHGGNKTQAARALGVSLRSLYRKLERLGLKDRPAP